MLPNVAFALDVDLYSEKLNKIGEVSKREELGRLTVGLTAKILSLDFRHRK